ncbi:GDSL esterase/lipase At4g10955 [Selaginella moellendorffii]|uniref:GDSL esterase/lipase At4g10955 n=1 Tax=Selaginella moellendorffii TaxID=88036 RepID=UPI000D1CE181|nr:GDSL esterase/lipase At4g10955 [Selaginella moellendorffii]|eukprot:XP_024541292.1 GDSL esterase/lipase At4g10955 [Selaginella moellendorffii]
MGISNQFAIEGKVTESQGWYCLLLQQACSWYLHPIKVVVPCSAILLPCGKSRILQRDTLQEALLSGIKRKTICVEEDKSDLQLTCYGLDGNFGYPSREVRGLLKNILVTRPDPLKGAGSRVDQANAAVSVRGRLRRVSGGRDVLDDKRAILACLVSSVYSLQHDRSKNYTGTPQALAPPWWTSFNYELLDVILGNDKLRINGAVFVWNYKNHWKPARAPMVVLALRGTDSLTSDYIVDFKIANQELYKTGRFTAAYNALRNAVAWHGKDNASHGQFVEAHLFNPPFSSSTAPYKSLFGAETYSNLQEVYTVAKAGLVNLLVDAAKRRESEAEFAALGSWYPDMYVHPSDPVCSGFLEHFKNYQYMLQGKYARLAMPHESIRGVLCSSKAKPHHLIPSARLHVPADEGKAASARDAHSLTQWWSDGAVVQVQFVNLTGQEHLDHPLQIPFGGISYEAMV